MTNPDLMDMMKQVIGNASGPHTNPDTLAGMMALLNLFGIVNYLNSAGGAPSHVGMPAGPAYSSAETPAGLNPEMLMSMLSMLGGMPGAAAAPSPGTVGGNSSPGGMPAGLNPEMLMSMLSMLGGTPGAAAAPSPGTVGGNSSPGGMPSGFKPEMLMSMLSMLGGMPGAVAGANTGPANNAAPAGGMPSGFNPEMLMGMLSMLGNMPGTAGNQNTVNTPPPNSGPVTGINPDMLKAMLSMLSSSAQNNQNSGGNTWSGLAGLLANMSPEMLMGLMSMLGNLGGGRLGPGRRNPPAADTQESEGEDSLENVSEESYETDYGTATADNSVANPQMIMLLMNLLGSLSQNQGLRTTGESSPM